MAGQPDGAALECDVLRLHQRLQHAAKTRAPEVAARSSGRSRSTLIPGSSGLAAWNVIERSQQIVLETPPRLRRKSEHRYSATHRTTPRRSAMRSISLRRQRMVAREGRQIDIKRRTARAMRPATAAGRPARSASSCASRSGVRRLRAGARRSRNVRRRSCAAPEYRAARSGRRPPPRSACSSTSCTRPASPGRDRRILEQRDARTDFGRGVMQTHRHPVAERLRLAGEHAQRRVDAVRRRMQRRIEHDVAARDRILRDAVAGEIERAALAGLPALGRCGSARGWSARAPKGPRG